MKVNPFTGTTPSIGLGLGARDQQPTSATQRVRAQLQERLSTFPLIQAMPDPGTQRMLAAAHLLAQRGRFEGSEVRHG